MILYSQKPDDKQQSCSESSIGPIEIEYYNL